MKYLNRIKLLLTTLAAVLMSVTFAAADLIPEIQARGVLKVGMAESPPWQSPNLVVVNRRYQR